ncbi:MAG: O-antigen ligase family protein, partial [Acidimicrobiales bacterium]
MAIAVRDESPTPVGLTEAQANWRQSAAYRSRPRFLEQLVGMIALTVLTTGLPTEWFVVIDGDLYASVNVGGPLVIVVFTVLIGTLLVFSMKRPKAMFYLLVCDLALVGFSLLILFSPLWSVDFATSVRRSVALTLVTLLGIYFVARYSLEQLINRLAIVFFIAMVLNVIWVNVLPQYGKSILGDDFLGITTNRNTLGQQAVLGCLVMVFAFRSRNHRIIAVFGFLGSAYLVLGTNSKTSLASLILLGLLLIVFSTFRARKQLFGAVIVSEVTAGLFGLLIATANLVFITDLLDRDITLTGRTVLWEHLLEPISEKPILGHGWEAFWGGWGSPAHEIWLKNSWFPPTAHNAPLEYLLALGAVGLTIWTIMMTRGLWRSIHYLRDRPGIAGLFPIAIFSYALLYSITEAGVVRRGIDWMLVV